MLKQSWKRLNSTLNLSFELAKAGFKLKNEGSYLGIIWYLINPIIMFLLLFAIFSTRLGADIANYGIYLFLGIIIFNFFQTATIESTRAIVINTVIIKSINFNKRALILGILLKNCLSHLFEIALLIILLIFFKISLSGMIFYPLVFILYLIFIYGLSLILSSINVFFIDLENIWGFFTRILFFMTPIFYIIGEQSKLLFLNLANPLYYFITLFREIIIYQRLSSPLIFLGALTFSLVSLLAGLLIFHHLNNKFAERI